MVSHHPAIFGGHRHCGSRDIIFYLLKSKIPPACLNQSLLLISKAQGMSCSPHEISKRRQSYCLFVTGKSFLQQQLVEHTQ